MKLKMLIIATVLTLTAFNSYAGCTYSKDVIGNIQYSCDSGVSGTLQEDAVGNMRDSQTGVTYREDVLGNVHSSDGTTWRQDTLGNWRSSDGTTCRTDVLGKARCQ